MIRSKAENRTPKSRQLRYKGVSLSPAGKLSQGVRCRVAQITDNRFSNVLFYGAVLALAYFVIRVFLPFFTPLGWAAVFAVVSSSWNERLRRK